MLYVYPAPKPVGEGGGWVRGREKVIKIVWDAGRQDQDPVPLSHPFQTLVVRDRGTNNPIIKQQ